MHTRYYLADKLVCIVRIARNRGKFNYLRPGEAPEAARAQSGRLNFLQAGDGPQQSAILSAMNRTVVLCAAALAAGFGFSVSMPVLADDSAASIAAGGLVPRREMRIVMAKEVLQISPAKVIVDYDFRNDTDQDVTTEVAFPVPPYAYGPDSPTIPEAVVFRLRACREWQERAIPNRGQGYTERERRHCRFSPRIRSTFPASATSLKPMETTRKFTLRILSACRRPSNSAWQSWAFTMPKMDGACGSRALQYHWTQTFPAHSTRPHPAPIHAG